MSSLDRVKAALAQIKADCNRLEREGTLTERGKGQLDVVRLLEEVLNA